MNTLSEFSELLRDARNRNNLSQSKLAEISGVGQSSISQYESGNKKPSKETVTLLASCLQLGTADTGRLLLAAGYSPDLAYDFSHPLLQTVSTVLNDPILERSNGPIIINLIQQFVEAWLDYSGAKEAQYKRKWDETAIEIDLAEQKLLASVKLSQAYVYDTKGVVELHRGETENAEAMFTSVRNIIEELAAGIEKDDDLPAEYRHLRGIIFSHLGDLNRSKSRLNQALDMYESALQDFSALGAKFPDIKIISEARLYRKIGSCYLSRGDPLSAQIHLIRSRDTLEQLLSHETHSRAQYEYIKTLMYLGWMYGLKGDSDEALNYRRRALELAKEYRLAHNREDEYLLLQGYLYYGYELLHHDNLRSADECLQIAMKYAESLGEPKEPGLIWLGRARIYVALGNQSDQEKANLYWDDAEDFFIKAYKINTKYGNQLRTAATLNRWGEFYLLQKNIDAALSKLYEARRIFSDLSNFHYIADVAVKLCEAHIMKGNFSLANDISAQELRSLQNASYKECTFLILLHGLRGRALIELANLQAANRESRYSEALEQYIIGLGYTDFCDSNAVVRFIEYLKYSVRSLVDKQGIEKGIDFFSVLHGEYLKPERNNAVTSKIGGQSKYKNYLDDWFRRSSEEISNNRTDLFYELLSS